MTLARVPYNTINYTAQAADIVDNKIAGASIIGSKVYITDTGATYVILPDLTLAAITRQDVSASIDAALPIGENHIGTVREEKLIEYGLVLDTNIYASGDVMSITAVLPTGVRVNGGTMIPLSMMVLDEDNQGGAFDILFFKTMVDIGTINAAYDITDAEMENYLGRIVVTAADYVSWTNNKTAIIQPGDSGWKVSAVLQAASDSTNIHIATISRDTKTYTATGVKLRFAVSR